MSNSNPDNSMPVTDTVASGLGTVVNETYDYINGLLTTPSVIFIFLLVIIVYIIVFSGLGSNGSVNGAATADSSSGASGATIIGTIVVGIFIV